MEEEVDPYQLTQAHWNLVAPSALLDIAFAEISKALVGAREPLIVTGYCGRNHNTIAALVELADAVKGIRVLDTGGVICVFPQTIRTADMILVVDCDVPWINTLCYPSATAKVIHIDVDPLKQQFPVFYLAAEARYRADSLTAISQLSKYIKGTEVFSKQLSDYSLRERPWQKHTKRALPKYLISPFQEVITPSGHPLSLQLFAA